jgi:hypothetical protein
VLEKKQMPASDAPTLGVSYEGTLPASAQPGERISAVFPGGQHAVFPPHGSHYWISAVLLMLVVVQRSG